ncbi:Ribonuclease P protein subunit p29 [Diplodia seriata]|uniref:Ribonuclease P protein subunit n=1 Tax=Diplodia seriata TaxID=420778 RepID=A0A1S8B9H0_9PEZI|nr:Ribonuclease P protein subunit p29 [Diplodia seriata]
MSTPDAAAAAAATAAASTPATTTTTNPSHALLSRAHSPDTSLRIFTDRVQKKPLLLRPTETTDIPTDARSQRRATCHRQQLRAKKSAASKPAPLSAAQKRALGIYAIPTAQRRYEIFEGLHRMWVGYMREVLGLKEEGGGVGEYVTPATVGPKLASADFHGAEVEVVRCRCVGRVGVRGIVVKDTKFTFEIITRRNKVKTIPKEHTVFRFEIPLGSEGGEGAKKPRNLVFELHGSQFENRAPDRANKKFKQHAMFDL